MSIWKRISCGFAIGIAFCLMYAWFFGIQTYYVWKTRRVARDEPALWTKPIALTDLSISQSQGEKISYFGYQFEVPWDDIDREKTKILGDKIAVVVFHSGNVISFWSQDPYGLISRLRADGKIDRASLEQTFGKEAAQSDYDFTRVMLETTPDSFSILMPKMEAIHHGSFFMMKVAIVPLDADSRIFSISTEQFRGFQFGRPPQVSPKHVRVELFHDDEHVDIGFGQKPGGSTAVSQADVNLVVQSVHKIANQEPRSGESSHN
jgi:hypothetical protein